MKRVAALFPMIGLMWAVLDAPAIHAADATADEPAPTALVETVVVESRDVPQKLEAYGSIGTTPGQQRSISALRNAEVDGIDVVAGAAVHKGQLLMTLKATPDSRVAYAQAKSAADAAHASLDQNERLFTAHLITNAQLADARKAASDADANLKAQDAIGGDAAVNEIRAPSEGVVDSVSVHAGDRVAGNTPLLTFSSTDPLFAQLGVTPEDAAKVRPGMTADVQAVFAPAATGAGKVAQVGAALDAGSGLVEIVVRLSTKSELVPGSAVNGEIILARVKGPAVPRAAVLIDDKGSYLFTVKGGKAHRVDVETGPDDGKYIAVTHGIKTGDRVVTVGNYELEDGMAIQEQTH